MVRYVSCIYSITIEYIDNSLMIFTFSYRCHHRGHLAHECKKDLPQRIQCFQCQGFGHIARDCTVVKHHFRCKDVKNSSEDYQSSSRSTKTKAQQRNLSYTTAAPQRKFREHIYHT